MTQEELDKAVRLHGMWRRGEESGERANFEGLDLSGADLSGANLSGVNLSRVNLLKANLLKANLSGANLSRAHLSRANLSGANLSEANLRKASLSESNLSKANLSKADLSKAHLSRANLSGANLSEADLSKAGLLEANFDGATLPFSVDPIHGLKSKIRAAIKSEGFALDMGEWHTCETVHCIAGWAVALSGEIGKEIESKSSTYLAGRLLLGLDHDEAEVFFESNENAMRWLEGK